MFKILLIALICYMCFVVYKTKRDMLIEEKKKKHRSSGTTCLLVSERKQAYWQGTRTCYCSNERNHLRKGCSKYIRFSSASVQMNVGEEEKALEQDKEVAKEVEYVEEFEHTPASEAVYEIPFPSDEEIPEEVFEYEETFLELEQLPIPVETEQNLPFPQAVSEVEDMNVVRWTVKVIGREQGLTRVLKISDNKRYWIHTEGEILPENQQLYIELQVDSQYSYTLVEWSDRQLGNI